MKNLIDSIKTTAKKVGLPGLILASVLVSGCAPKITESHKILTYKGQSQERPVTIFVDQSITTKDYSGCNRNLYFRENNMLKCTIEATSEPEISGIDTNYDGIWDSINVASSDPTPKEIFTAREKLDQAVKDAGAESNLYIKCNSAF